MLDLQVALHKAAVRVTESSKARPLRGRDKSSQALHVLRRMLYRLLGILASATERQQVTEVPDLECAKGLFLQDTSECPLGCTKLYTDWLRGLSVYGLSLDL